MSFNLSISVAGEVLYFEVSYFFVCSVSLIYVGFCYSALIISYKLYHGCQCLLTCYSFNSG